MYNPKDIQFAGKHDYDREAAENRYRYKFFRLPIFKWELKANGKELKKGKAVVRILSIVSAKKEVFEVAESIVMVVKQ